MKDLMKFVWISVVTNVFLAFPVIAEGDLAANSVGYDRNSNGTVRVGEIRRQLKKGEVDESKTCLDEYVKRVNRLIILDTVTPVVGSGAAIGTGIAVA